MQRLFGGFTILVFVSITIGGSAEAESRCKKVKGHLSVAATATGCTSPVAFCTAGTFDGNGKLDDATTSFTASSLTYSAGLGSAVPATTLSYAGALTLTARRGTVTFDEVGLFDTVNGRFTELSNVASGSGIFAGATGHLFITGTGSTSFDADVEGEICRADKDCDDDWD